MENIFKKDIWSQAEWDIYINNINILRNRDGLEKKDFNKKIGVANAFRRDLNKPGRGTMLSICKEYEIDEVWLSTKHDKYESVKELDEDYNLHGGFKPRPEMLSRDHQMLGKAFDILRSRSVYRNALMANIEAFYNALEVEKKHSECMEIRQKLQAIIEIKKFCQPPEGIPERRRCCADIKKIVDL